MFGKNSFFRAKLSKCSENRVGTGRNKNNFFFFTSHLIDKKRVITHISNAPFILSNTRDTVPLSCINTVKQRQKSCTSVPFLLLKVPKREIFDRSDLPDFYTITSLRVGDFGVKIKKKLENI